MENIPYTVQIKPAGNGQPKQRISVLKINPEGKHYTTGVQIQSDFSFGKNNIFISGIDAWQRNLVSNRERRFGKTSEQLTDANESSKL